MRRIYIVWNLKPWLYALLTKLEGDKLVPVRTTFIQLSNGDFNVPAVAQKVMESVNGQF